MSDRGLTHVALPVRNVKDSVAFYRRFAAMEVVHERTDAVTGGQIAWVSDRTRPFVVVLIQVAEVKNPLLPIGHLGLGCASREEVDRLVAEARAEGRPVYGPIDAGYPVGYFALISDPDHHTLEVSFGQEVALAVAQPGSVGDAKA
jgi:catechol 2,3-dioxygenase-like lactoylglutathione lyase family enzyme